MSFADVMDQLPTLTFAERQMLVRRAVELDDTGLSVEDEARVEHRLTEHRRDPESALPSSEMKSRLRSRYPA